MFFLITKLTVNPLDWIYAVDLEAYIAGGDSDGEHPSPTMSSASLEADEDFMDPRTFIRPSTPLFGFHNSEDDEDDETSEKITRNGENDGHDAHGVAETPAAGGQFQRENVKEHHRQSAFTDLKLVPFVDEREIDSLFAGDGE